MKTLRIFGMALLTVLMCVNFVSCSNEEAVPDEQIQGKYITVGLNCIGEYIDVTESPLSRAVGDDYYLIQVFSLDTKNQKYIPYAYGGFETSLNDVTIKLLQGKSYKFEVAVIVGGAREEGRDWNFHALDNEFEYSSLTTGLSPAYRIPVCFEGFYGELEDYTPTEGNDVKIETKRVSYAAKIIAEDLNEGELKITTSNGGDATSLLWKTSLTTTQLEHEKIYSFSDVMSAWKNENYSKEKTIGIQWVKSENEILSLGNYKITFKRNIRTTIRIKAEELSVSNGITVTLEDTEITDDENEYEISGGEIVEVPVNSES